MVDDLKKLSSSSKKISLRCDVGRGEMAHFPVVAQFPPQIRRPFLISSPRRVLTIFAIPLDAPTEPSDRWMLMVLLVAYTDDLSSMTDCVISSVSADIKFITSPDWANCVVRSIPRGSYFARHTVRRVICMRVQKDLSEW